MWNFMLLTGILVCCSSLIEIGMIVSTLLLSEQTVEILRTDDPRFIAKVWKHWFETWRNIFPLDCHLCSR